MAKVPMSDVIERFPSSSGSAVYEVQVGRDGRAWCSCVGWKFCKGSPKFCKHLKLLVGRGVLDTQFYPVQAGAPPTPTPVAVAQAQTPVARKGAPEVMLAHQVEKAPYEPWDRPDWVAELKYDGMRLVLVATPARVLQYSRLGNLHEYEFLSRLRLPAGTVLDGELVGASDASEYASGKRQDDRFVLFDALQVGERRLVQESWTVRRLAVEMIVEKMGEPRLVASRVLGVPSKAEAERLVSEGAEGVMLKVVIVDMEALPTATDRIAAGWRGLRYGYMTPDGLVVAGSLGVTGPPEELAQHIGKVAEVKCYAVGKAGALRHPVFIQWRTDKAPEECVLP